MKLVATIEARMTSSRLPGKVLLPADGKPMLKHLFDRLRQVPSLQGIVLATTVNPTDQVLVDLAAKEKIPCFRGSEDDVMSRVIGAAESVNAELIVEITGDCPIIDPWIVEQTIQTFLHNSCDYVCNSSVRSYPIGMDTQVYALQTLKDSFAMTTDRLDREHVTRHILLHPEKFSQIHMIAPHDLYWPELRLTLDEQGDYRLIKNIIEYFGPANPFFHLGEVVSLLKNVHPEWCELNKTVRQKTANE